MKNAAVLCNNLSSDKSARVELINSLREHCDHVYVGGIYNGTVHESFRADFAEFMPIRASRDNVDPIKELRSLTSVCRAVKEHDIDTVLIYGIKNHAAMAIGSRLGKAKNILCVVNGSGNLFRIGGIMGSLVRFISFPMLKLAYKFSKTVCFQNPDDYELLLKKRLITKKTNTIITGGSGVNLESFPCEPLPKENRFLFLSRITATKGIKEFCEAAEIVKEKYPDAAFDVVGPLDAAAGSGVVKDILDDAVKKGIVEYHGYTDRVKEWMGSCRFFIYPSYYPEGVPRCVLQALSTGRAVITCDTTGCRETVIDSYNGFLVEPRNAIQLSEKMILMMENEQKVEEMAANSRALAEEKFNVSDINRQLIDSLS